MGMDQRLNHRRGRLGVARILGYVGLCANDDVRKSLVHAEASLADPNLFRPFGSIEETETRLRTIRGIGEWTAQYIALRAIREMDAFPATDIGLLRTATSINGAKTTSANLLSRAESWRPWRAYAAQHLWAASGNTAAGHLRATT